MNIYVYTLLDAPLVTTLRDALETEHSLVFRDAANTSAGEKQHFSGADVILGNPPRQWFEESPPLHLKFWQLDSAGFDQYRSLDLAVRAANMGDWFARPCAETIVGGILALYRGLPKLAVLQSRKEWVGTPLREELGLLYRKQVVILGAGTIGEIVRALLLGFGASVKTVARTAVAAEIHSREALFAELPHTDVVVNTLPGSAVNYVDAPFFRAMKKGGIYANVGRGSTTDEDALVAALKAGDLAGAVLDVTAIEPLPAESPLWDMKQVLLTQHTGGGQANENRGKAAFFLENMRQLVSGQPLFREIDLKRGY